MHVNGEKIIGSETFWAVFNTKTRRPEGLALPHEHFELYPEKKATVETFSKINITHEKERALLLSILKFNETIDETLSHLALNKLADYVYNVSVKFSEFFDECRIKDSEHMKSRLLIVELTKRFLEKGFFLLGLTPVERI